MRWLIICWFLLPVLTGCVVPRTGATPDPFGCSTVIVKATALQVKMGRPVSARVLDAVFGRLDAQRRVEVQETQCGMSVVSLRYVKPRRMQIVAWLNTGLTGHSHATRDPRQTRIGNKLGYIGAVVSAPWEGMGLEVHRMLLPDAWRGSTTDEGLVPNFYLVGPPDPPVRDLSLRSFADGTQRIFVEHWRGLLDRCPPGAQCPAPNTDPRFFARYTSVLRVDSNSGLPVSLTTVAQARGRARGQFAWARVEPIAQTTFRYGGHFSVNFVKG